MKSFLTKNFTIILGAILFTLINNSFDLYSMYIDLDRWIPVGTPPISIGDEYHYYSILKMFVYDDISNISYTELSRLFPYILNVPIYYVGSELFDTRFGILFIRIYNMLLLYFALYYFLYTINKINKWQHNKYIIIFSIFTIFYCFTGFRNLFASSSLDSVITVLTTLKYNVFNYLLYDFSYVYNYSSMNSLSRAINSSTSTPIILFIFAYRLNKENISIYEFLILLFILIMTSLPVAVAFGIVSVLIDIYSKQSKEYIIKTIFFGSIFGIAFILLQSKLILSGSIASSEVMHLGFDFIFKKSYFIAPFIAILISLIGRKYLSPYFIILLIVTSLFQPLGFLIGGTHGNRLWLRSNILIFNPLLIYTIIVFSIFSINKILYDKYNIIKTIFASSLLFIYAKFAVYNALYLIKHNERFVSNKNIIKFINKIKKDSIIVTNSPEISLLTSIYDKNAKPLMIHFSLQKDGYIQNLERTYLNFKLINNELTIKEFLLMFKKDDPIRKWARYRISDMDIIENSYSSNILFSATYCSYNKKMLENKHILTSKKLTNFFYNLDLNISSIDNEIKGKNIIYVLDKSLPFGKK
jgi:hypothetical protein